MACFLVPAAEAVATTITKKVLNAKEKNQESPEEMRVEIDTDGCASTSTQNMFAKHLNWLNVMLWGGTILLLIEHIYHGEVVPWFPFLTAAAEPGGWSVIFHEMMTVGVSMAAVATGVWAVLVLASKALAPRLIALRERIRLGYLSLFFGGAAIMFLVDALCAAVI